MILRIPVTYEQDELIINCLNLKGTGTSIEEAYDSLLQNSPEFYAALKNGEVKSDTHTGKMFIYVNYTQKLYDRITDLEPVGKDKEPKQKKDNKAGLKQADSEEIIKYGY